MRETILKIGAASIVIFYLFGCGIIYLTSFWTTFTFDISNYIDILDVPKSFIYPLVDSLTISLVLSITLGAIMPFRKKYNRSAVAVPESITISKEVTTPLIKKKRQYFPNIDIVFVLLLAATAFIRNRQSALFYIVTGSIMVTYLAIKIAIAQFLHKLIPDGIIRMLVVYTIFIVPLYTFFTGKINSIMIRNNSHCYFVKSIILKDNTASALPYNPTKYIGKLGTTMFLSDTANSSLTLIHFENIDHIEFKLVK